MNFDQAVVSFSESAERLDKRAAIRIFSRWQTAFPRSDWEPRVGSMVRATEAHCLFDSKSSSDFYALFEYDSKIPITYRCRGLRPKQFVHPRNRDLAIVDFSAGWCIVFNHEDGAYSDGPCYYEVTEPANARDV